VTLVFDYEKTIVLPLVSFKPASGEKGGAETGAAGVLQAGYFGNGQGGKYYSC